MNNGLLKIIILLLFIVLKLSMMQNEVFAAGGVTVNQTRAIFKADGIAEDKKTLITIYNTSNENMDISLKKADFAISEDGAFQVKEFGSQPNSAKSYFNCDEQEFTLVGNSNKSFSVSLIENKEYNVPELISSILVKYVPSSLKESTDTIKTYTQIAISLRVLAGSKLLNNIDMSIDPLEIKRIGTQMIYPSGRDKSIPITLKNIGKITIEPRVSASLRSVFSDDIVGVPMGLGFVLAGNERTYNANISPKCIFDIYTITVTADYTYNGKNFSLEETCRFVVVSYQLLIGITLVLVGIIIQSLLYKRKIQNLKRLLQKQVPEVL